MVNSVVMYQKANATFGYECYHGKGTRKQNVYEGICQSMRRRDVLILMVMLSLFSSDLGRDLSDHLVIWRITLLFNFVRFSGASAGMYVVPKAVVG